MNNAMMDEMSEPVAQALSRCARAVRERGCCNLVGSRFPWPLSATGSTGAGGVMNRLAPLTPSYAPALIAASGPCFLSLPRILHRQYPQRTHAPRLCAGSDGV